MMIQPLVENTIEHAFQKKQLNRVIEVSITFANKQLTCTMMDNRIGIDSYEKREDYNKKSLATSKCKNMTIIICKK